MYKRECPDRKNPESRKESHFRTTLSQLRRYGNNNWDFLDFFLLVCPKQDSTTSTPDTKRQEQHYLLQSEWHRNGWLMSTNNTSLMAIRSQQFSMLLSMPNLATQICRFCLLIWMNMKTMYIFLTITMTTMMEWAVAFEGRSLSMMKLEGTNARPLYCPLLVPFWSLVPKRNHCLHFTPTTPITRHQIYET